MKTKQPMAGSPETGDQPTASDSGGQTIHLPSESIRVPRLRLNTKKTRRDFLISSASSALTMPTAVGAFAHSRFRSGRSQVLTTLRFVNETRNPVDAGSVTQLIGCPFRKGDIPAGDWPQFQLTDGNPVPCTILGTLATRWSDGSLKFVPAMLQIPEAIGGHQAVVVNVLSGGWLPQPSPRSLSDFQTGIAPQVQVDGLDNLSGTWVMSLVTGISEHIKIIEYGNGPAGAVWKVRARAHQGNKHHKHLLCDFYIASLANLDGSLKGLRILGKVKLPYYDTKATMNWMSFSRFQLCLSDDGTLIRDCFGKNFGASRAYDFTWQSGAVFAANHGYSTANYGDYGYCTRLSSTGTLPSGLSANTSYFSGNVTTTTIGFGTNAAVPGGHLVAAVDGGSGAHTATPYPYLAYFGALFTAGPTGMWDFVQGPGTDAKDTSLRCEMNQKYWVSTRLIPPYDIRLKPARNAATSYWPNSAEPVTRYGETTGERNDLGILPSWYVRHFLTQAAVDEQVVRVVSLVGGQFSIGLESAHTLTIPCVNNGPRGDGNGYRRMPAPNTQFYWHPPGNTRGFPYGDTTDPNVPIAGMSQQITNHMPQFNYYPYLLTGEPWHLDMLIEHANSAVYQRYAPVGTANISETSYSLGGGGRNLTVPQNATTFGDTVGGNEQRADAWASALLAAAAGICPDINPDCASYKSYFCDMNSTTWTAAVNIYKALPPYAKKYGLWHVVSNTSFPYMDHWQMAYLGTALSLAVSITEDKRAHIALEGLIKWFDHVVAKFGGWHAGSYMTIIKSNTESNGPLVTSDRGVAFFGPKVQWSLGEHFIMTPFSNYTPANGDKFIFADSVGGLDQVTPAGFSKYTPYYIVNLNGTQFDLSNVPGGAPIPLTDSYGGSAGFFIVANQPPSTGSISYIGNSPGYNTEVLGMLNYALATGAKVNAATITDLAYRDQQAGTSFVSDPKWALSGTFAQ